MVLRRLFHILYVFTTLIFVGFPVMALGNPANHIKPNSHSSKKSASQIQRIMIHPVSFTNDVEPTLTRLGCNEGACHGSQFGKDGFKLSLFGVDNQLDYDALTRQARGRRVSVADPLHSLILLKPTLQIPHGGGKRLIIGSPAYYTLLNWIREGAPGPNSADPTAESISISPAERVARRGSPPFKITVHAYYSNHSVRDVTSLATITTIDDGVASASPDGVVRPVGSGETAIMARFSGLVSVCSVIVPYSGSTVKRNGAQNASASINGNIDEDQKLANQIDLLVAQKQKEINLSPSPICGDRTFIRRLYFSVIGTMPTPSDVEEFLADRRPDKRVRLIDAVLARPEYADYWSLKWADLLRVNRTTMQVKGMWSFDEWLHSQMAKNTPADKFVRRLILAQGSAYMNGAANYYLAAQDPEDLAETTSQVFLGVRLQCAKCHHHPFEKWSQNDYYSFSAFFARVGIKNSNDFGIFGNDRIIYIRENGEVYNPVTNQPVMPEPLGVKQPKAQTADMHSESNSNFDPRKALSDWITSPKNPWFARNLVNRYWAYLLGVGIVNPIDDERATNPPTNPALLELLTNALIKYHFDLKHLIRVICMTQTFQRSSRATLENARDTLFFTHYIPQRLPAEVVYDAIDAACGAKADFGGLPASMRAVDLPDPNIGSGFLDAFGRPSRLTACECERQEQPNLEQSLVLMNGNDVNNKVDSPEGRIARLISSGASDNTIINQLYMAALGRTPTARERYTILGLLTFAPNRSHLFQDVLVTLLGSKEFLFNH